MRRAWDSWKVTIIAVAAIVAVGSLASANPSLRQPRGPRPSPTAASGTTGVSGSTGATGPTGSAVVPVRESGDEGGPNIRACDGMTGLDRAICRHKALLVIHPDNKGLQNALARLRGNKNKRESAGEKHGHPHGGNPHVVSAHGGEHKETPDKGHGQSEASHENVGGNGHGNAGGNGHGNGS